MIYLRICGTILTSVFVFAGESERTQRTQQTTINRSTIYLRGLSTMAFIGKIAKVIGWRLTLILGVGGVAAVGAGGVAVVDTIQTQQARQAAISTYGEAAMNLCSTLERGSGELAEGTKLIVIDAKKGIIHETYQSALPAEVKATGTSDLGAVACIEEVTEVADVDEYGESGGNTRYTCNEYQYIFNIYVKNVQTGETVLYDEVEGSTPPDCPMSTDRNTQTYGERPTTDDVVAVLLEAEGMSIRSIGR
jgi:hypothetical protein